MRIITLQALDNDDLPCRSVHLMLRLPTYKSLDTLLVSATWTLTEAELAVTCANLPLLRPVFPRNINFLRLKSFIRNGITKSSGSDQSNTGDILKDGRELEAIPNARVKKHGSRLGYYVRASSSGSDEHAITTVEENGDPDTSWLKTSSSASHGRSTPVV